MNGIFFKNPKHHHRRSTMQTNQPEIKDKQSGAYIAAGILLCVAAVLNVVFQSANLMSSMVALLKTLIFDYFSLESLLDYSILLVEFLVPLTLIVSSGFLVWVAILLFQNHRSYQLSYVLLWTRSVFSPVLLIGCFLLLLNLLINMDNISNKELLYLTASFFKPMLLFSTLIPLAWTSPLLQCILDCRNGCLPVSESSPKIRKRYTYARREVIKMGFEKYQTALVKNHRALPFLEVFILIMGSFIAIMLLFLADAFTILETTYFDSFEELLVSFFTLSKAPEILTSLLLPSIFSKYIRG